MDKYKNYSGKCQKMNIVKGKIEFSIPFHIPIQFSIFDCFIEISFIFNLRMAYLSHLDIRGIDCFKDDTLLAVKAPYGSTLEVPDPDEGMSSGERRYEIQLNSRSGPIDVFLIQDIPLGINGSGNTGNCNNHGHNHASSHAVMGEGNENIHNSVHSEGMGGIIGGLAGTGHDGMTAGGGFGHGHHMKEGGCCTHLKHFELPSDPYSFELRPGESLGDLYAGLSDVFGNIFTTSNNNSNHENNLPASAS